MDLAHVMNVHAIKMHANIFWNHVQAHLAPKLPFFESHHVREYSCKCASLAITYNDKTTYQTIHLKHNNSITWAKTVLGNNSNQM